MGYFNDQEQGEVTAEQKWDYITLSDFSSSSWWTFFTYGWLWFLAILAVAAYGADTYTAVILLAYNRWSSEIQPAIPYDVSKWIFAGCIMLSWILCAFEWLRAIRVIRRGGVAESYLDPLVVILQSLRITTNGHGWRRFLVFTELTKSRKGVDYIALFVYFQFKGAIRIILAESPRQVVNALTLYSILNSDLIPDGKHAATQGHSSLQQFFINIQVLAQANKEQAIIIFTMLFTFIIWVVSAICLVLAVVLYLVFLWHYIPQRDGRLSVYCRRKIDRRLEKIVDLKMRKVLKTEGRLALEQESSSDCRYQLHRQPTLPNVANADEKLPSFATVSRYDSFDSSSDWSAKPTLLPSAKESELEQQFNPQDAEYHWSLPQPPSRSESSASNLTLCSPVSEGPLLVNAARMGSAPPQRNCSTATLEFFPDGQRVVPIRSLTGSTASFHHQRPRLAQPAQNIMSMRQNSASTIVSPLSLHGTGMETNGYFTPESSLHAAAMLHKSSVPPSTSAQPYEMSSQPFPSLQRPPTVKDTGYVAFHPRLYDQRASGDNIPPTDIAMVSTLPTIKRDMARALPPSTNVFDPPALRRVGTAPPQFSSRNPTLRNPYLPDAPQRPPPTRAATAGPSLRTGMPLPGAPAYLFSQLGRYNYEYSMY